MTDSNLNNTNQENLDLLWGAREIARAIGRTETQARWMIRSGHLPTKKIGKLHVASKTALRRAFAAA